MEHLKSFHLRGIPYLTSIKQYSKDSRFVYEFNNRVFHRVVPKFVDMQFISAFQWIPWIHGVNSAMFLLVLDT